MTLPQFILDKVKPFIDSFNRDLKSKLDVADRELSAKGLIKSGARVKRYQAEFLSLLNELINKIAETIFNDIKNKQLAKPEFSALRISIEQLIQPLIDQFRIDFATQVRQLIPKGESANSIVTGFDNDLQSQVNKQFIDVEQEFDAIQ